MQVHTCYLIVKGSKILVYCRVCTKPSMPSLSQEGNAPLFARDHQTQGYVQTPWQNASLASTFSLSREPRLQAHLHFPYCGCINPSSPPFLFALINCSMVWIFSASRFSCFPFCHCWKTRKATQHKSNINTVFPKVVSISVDTCPNGFKLFNPSWRLFNKSDPAMSGRVLLKVDKICHSRSIISVVRFWCPVKDHFTLSHPSLMLNGTGVIQNWEEFQSHFNTLRVDKTANWSPSQETVCLKIKHVGSKLCIQISLLLP